jgi:HEAT repeat protein
LAFGTISDPLLAVALYTGIGALASTVALIVAIIGARIGLVARLKVEREAAQRWHPVLAECAERVPDALPRLQAREVEPLLVLWCRAQESLRGAAQDQLRELAHRLGLPAAASRMLRSGRLRLELLALVAVGHLRTREVVPLLTRLVPEAPTVMALTAAQALIRIDPGVGIPCLLTATAAREDWTLAPVVSMLMECDPRHVASVLSTAISVELEREAQAGQEGSGLARLLRLHVAAHGEVLRPAVLAALDKATMPEPLAAALGAISHPADVAHARRLLDHHAVPVRVAAARVLARLGGVQDFDRLTAALGDRDWWVRYRAAQALCALPGASSDRLRALGAGLADRFAADMLRQALAEKEAA